MRETFEPFTKKQRDELKGYVAWSITLFRAAIFAAAVSFVGWLLSLAHSSVSRRYPAVGHDAWWIVPVVGFALALYVRAGRWTGGRALRAAVSRDLEKGQASIRRVVAIDAIEIEEQEDEGPAYFILTDDRTTMLFAGQYLARLKSKGFPWKGFDIREAPHSKTFFGITPAGDRLTPSARRPPLTWEEARTFGVFKGNYRIVDVEFESLKRSN